MMALSSGEKEALKHGDMVYLLYDSKKPADCISFRIDPCDPPATSPGASVVSPPVGKASSDGGGGGGSGGGGGAAAAAAGTDGGGSTPALAAAADKDAALKFGRYKVLKNLGSGSFAEVRVCRCGGLFCWKHMSDSCCFPLVR
jgi:hypothetical protein